MPVPRSPYPVIGAVAAPLGLCVTVMVPVASLLGALITVGLVVLVSTAGVLLAADWRAEVESRQAWAEVAPVLADWSSAVGEQMAAVETGYVCAFDQDALHEVFRAHRFLPPQARANHEEPAASSASQRAPTHSASTQTTCEAEQGSASGEENNAGPLRRDNSTDQTILGASRIAASKVTVGTRRQVAREYCVLDGTRVPLVVNARSTWLASDTIVLRPAAAGHTPVIVLANCRDAQAAEGAATTEASSVVETQPPSCRGPPTLEQRRLARRAATAARRAAPTPDASSEPVVLDNLGQPVPVCGAEVNVVETYLGHVLEELSASSKDVWGPERA